MSRFTGRQPTGGAGATKICATCGRTFAWRRKWQRNWEAVRYCSERCRRTRPGPLDAQLEATILELLDARASGATICPSEAARAVAPDDWRELMERTRQAARRLVARGRLEITQRGRVVDPSTAKGPIRLRLCGTSDR
ncbi:MAG: DUF2256 and DUF3253 domain-containing protein [Acidobacteriota bacterium]